MPLRRQTQNGSQRSSTGILFPAWFRPMSTYVTLLKFDSRESEDRPGRPEMGALLRRAAKESQVQVKSLNWTIGHYDGVAILDAPDDDAVAATLEPLQVYGGLSAETLRSFPAAKIGRIVAHLVGEDDDLNAPPRPPGLRAPAAKAKRRTRKKAPPRKKTK